MLTRRRADEKKREGGGFRSRVEAKGMSQELKREVRKVGAREQDDRERGVDEKLAEEQVITGRGQRSDGRQQKGV